MKWRLKQVSGLYVLDFYCLESYLYHPENIHEIAPDANQFDVEQYRQDIGRQKHEQFGAIMRGLNRARSYVFLRDNTITTNVITNTIGGFIYLPVVHK